MTALKRAAETSATDSFVPAFAPGGLKTIYLQSLQPPVVPDEETSVEDFFASVINDVEVINSIIEDVTNLPGYFHISKGEGILAGKSVGTLQIYPAYDQADFAKHVTLLDATETHKGFVVVRARNEGEPGYGDHFLRTAKSTLDFVAKSLKDITAPSVAERMQNTHWVQNTANKATEQAALDR